MKKRSLYFCCLLVLSVVPLAGCASNGLTRSSSSVPLRELIEPVKDSRQTESKAPLTLPASVAILMAPGKYTGTMPNTTLRQAAEALKVQLLANPKFVSSVSIVTADDMKGAFFPRKNSGKLWHRHSRDSLASPGQEDRPEWCSGIDGRNDCRYVSGAGG